VLINGFWSNAALGALSDSTDASLNCLRARRHHRYAILGGNFRTSLDMARLPDHGVDA